MNLVPLLALEIPTLANGGVKLTKGGMDVTWKLRSGVKWHDDRNFDDPGSPLAIRSISAGDQSTCALDVTGAAWCWGAGSSGQLGNGSFTSSTSPVKVSGGLTFTQVSTGGSVAAGFCSSGSAR